MKDKRILELEEEVANSMKRRVTQLKSVNMLKDDKKEIFGKFSHIVSSFLRKIEAGKNIDRKSLEKINSQVKQIEAVVNTNLEPELHVKITEEFHFTLERAIEKVSKIDKNIPKILINQKNIDSVDSSSNFNRRKSINSNQPSSRRGSQISINSSQNPNLKKEKKLSNLISELKKKELIAQQRIQYLEKGLKQRKRTNSVFVDGGTQEQVNQHVYSENKLSPSKPKLNKRRNTVMNFTKKSTFGKVSEHSINSDNDNDDNSETSEPSQPLKTELQRFEDLQDSKDLKTGIEQFLRILENREKNHKKTFLIKFLKNKNSLNELSIEESQPQAQAQQTQLQIAQKMRTIRELEEKTSLNSSKEMSPKNQKPKMSSLQELILADINHLEAEFIQNMRKYRTFKDITNLTNNGKMVPINFPSESTTARNLPNLSSFRSFDETVKQQHHHHQQNNNKHTKKSILNSKQQDSSTIRESIGSRGKKSTAANSFRTMTTGRNRNQFFQKSGNLSRRPYLIEHGEIQQMQINKMSKTASNFNVTTSRSSSKRMIVVANNNNNEIPKNLKENSNISLYQKSVSQRRQLAQSYRRSRKGIQSDFLANNNHQDYRQQEEQIQESQFSKKFKFQLNTVLQIQQLGKVTKESNIMEIDNQEGDDLLKHLYSIIEAVPPSKRQKFMKIDKLKSFKKMSFLAFKKIIKEFRDQHSGCGSGCVHLMRFYEKLGVFNILEYAKIQEGVSLSKFQVGIDNIEEGDLDWKKNNYERIRMV